MFKAVHRQPKLTERVTRDLEGLIADNQLRPGDRLPAVTELAAQYGVSRTVVREAIGALSARGLLEVRHGSGTVVRRPSAETVAKSLSLFLRAGQPQLEYAKVSQVRRVLELEIVGLAAEHRTAENLAELTTLVEAMAGMVQPEGQAARQREAFVQNDVAFHTALATATQNELFPLVLNSLADIMLEVRQLGFDVPGSPAYAVTAHRAILKQVAARNPQGAREAMAEHLARSEAIVKKGLAQQRG